LNCPDLQDLTKKRHILNIILVARDAPFPAAGIVGSPGFGYKSTLFLVFQVKVTSSQTLHGMRQKQDFLER